MILDKVLFFILLLVGKFWGAPIPGPPGSKRPRTDSGPATCIVQTSGFKGTISVCEGDLKQLSTLSQQAAPHGQAFGAESQAELLLLRSGIFEENLNLENFHICLKHENALGAGWVQDRANRPVTIRQGQPKPRCNMPPLPGLPGHPAVTHNLGTLGLKSLKKDGSLAIWKQQGLFVPLGTAMCSNHEIFVKYLEEKAVPPGTNEETGDINDDSAGPSSNPDQIATATRLRPLPRVPLPESPLERRTWTQTLRHGSSEDVCPVQSSPSISTGGSSVQESPDSQQIGSQHAYDQQCTVVQAAIRQIATTFDIPQGFGMFPRKNQFLALAADTQRKRVCLASNVVGKVMEAFAPDAPHELFKRIARKHAGDFWEKENSDKFADLVEAVVDLYRLAASRQERLQTLSLVAPMLRYLELQKFIPGLTIYGYKEARRYARLSRAGMKIPKTDEHKERYIRENVEHFISFITSSHVVTDMPFGHVNVRLSSGVKMELPNLVRTTVNQRIIAMYKQYLANTGKEGLKMSDSSYWRILIACKAITRKSLLGLDYYTYDGIEGIASLISLAEKFQAMDGDADWTQRIVRTLKDLKVFFKTDYKTLIQKQSQFADYSLWYAMSDPIDPAFQADNRGRPENMRRCAQCIAMEDAFQGFQNKIETLPWSNVQKKNEILFIFESAKSGITEWQKHIVRTINQKFAQEEILQNLGETDVWILMDFAMKFLPRQGVESQLDWYGKKGISWHIAVAYVRNETSNEFSMRTYAHILEPVAQDPETVIAIIEDVIRRIKSERPEIQNVYLRSDNAICYHASPTLLAIPLIAQNLGVSIKRYDFSEPQSGKGACDRATAIVKRHVNIYVDANNKCTTPQEFFTCASQGTGVSGVTFIHAGLQGAEGRGSKGEITDISRFHNFEYTPDGKIRGWFAYKIGAGKHLVVKNRAIPLPSLIVHKASSLGTIHTTDLLSDKNKWVTLVTKVQEPPPPVSIQNDEAWVHDESDDLDDAGPALSGPIASCSNTDDPDEAEGRHHQRLFACEEEGCTKVYTSYYNWFKHVSIGKHQYLQERMSLRDFSIKTYASQIAASDVIRSLPAVNAAINAEQEGETDPEGTQKLKTGWALKVRREAKWFTEAQVAFLTAKFDEGAATGIKHTPEQVSENMRSKFPNKDDWLTPQQIRGWFSRYAKKREKAGGQEGQAAATGRGRGRGRGRGQGQTGQNTESAETGQEEESMLAPVNQEEVMEEMIAINELHIEVQVDRVMNEATVRQ